jgi:hypothetical protein
MSDNPPMPLAPLPVSPAAAQEPAWAKPSIGIYSLSLFVLGLGVAWWSKNDTALNLMIGAIISNATTVIGYYFGSSSGSSHKTALLATKGPTP